MKIKTPFNISATSMQNFDDCQMKWAFQYAYKVPKKFVFHRPYFVGIAMHNMLKDFYLKQDESKFSKDWLISNWDNYYNNTFAKCYPKQAELKEGRNSLDYLYNILKSRNWLQKPIILKSGKPAVECRFNVPYNGHDDYILSLTGGIDLVLFFDNEYHVIDWKSGSDVSYQKKDLLESDQLILYSAALKKTDNIDDETLHYVYFYSDLVIDFKVENHHFFHIRDRINNIIDSYHNNSYSFNVGTNCQMCEYEQHCKNTRKSKGI